ncbi:MAG: hypothetical protein GY754_04055 [bacterium]|nr:hypothetical protein [bacterium]
MKPLSIGTRMKQYYEEAFKYKLPMRMPVIIRLDGKAFHTLTRKMKKPFDNTIIELMNKTALYLCEEIMGIQLAYIQSDEISLLLHNYKKLGTDAWFGNEVQKIVSVSAGMASASFSLNGFSKPVVFDSRVFVLPEAEVVNYFVWRQQDWTRNSVQMLARSYYSHKECHGKNNSALQEMIFQKDDNWDKLDTSLKRGRCAVKDSNGTWIIDNDIPVFTRDREYIETLLTVEEE